MKHLAVVESMLEETSNIADAPCTHTFGATALRNIFITTTKCINKMKLNTGSDVIKGISLEN